MNPPAEIRFHGVRGSAPSSGTDFAEFGGDTPSVEIVAGEARVFVDAGSGLKNVAVTQDFPEEFDLILSHYHYDHLIGLPFFEPAWRINGRLRIFAPQFGDADPAAILNTLFSSPFCPVRLEDLRPRVEIISYRPGDTFHANGGALISTASVNHPGGCSAIRICLGEGDVVYASDAEVADDPDAAALADFAKGALLFIADAMNDDADALHRRGWGHSSWRDMLGVARAAGVRTTALFHHDPRRTDISLIALDAAAQGVDPSAFMVQQGSRYRLHGRAEGPARRIAERGETAPWRCSR